MSQDDVSAILLAGGRGRRMQGDLPKQFISLCGRQLIEYSLEALDRIQSIKEIVIVCEEEYRDRLKRENYRTPILFVDPGPKRQDSVYNGFLLTSKNASLICIHDAARPFIDTDKLKLAFSAASEIGAALFALPVTDTLKRTHLQDCLHTVDREGLYRAQTPQIVRREILKRGFEIVQSDNLTVTDDVAIAEIAGIKARIIEGNPSHIKITTPEDLSYATFLIQNFPDAYRL